MAIRLLCSLTAIALAILSIALAFHSCDSETLLVTRPNEMANAVLAVIVAMPLALIAIIGGEPRAR